MRLKTVQNAFFITLLFLVTLAFFGLIQDFLQPLFWAAVLAVIFHPMYKRWRALLNGRSSLASVVTLLVILFIVILPLFLVGVAVTREAANLYERIATGEINLQDALQSVERAVPMANDLLERAGVDLDRVREGLAGAAVTASRFLASQALSIGQNALRITVLFFLMLYLLFFFLRDGERLLDGIIRALPLGDQRERHLFAKFAEVSRATLKGTIVVGVVQGTLGGVLFWLLGINAAVFWGVIMTLLSLLPAVGAAVVWVPAAIILFATGEVVKAVILVVAGTLIIGLVDNVLRPILVGRDTKMPDYLILLATLGGLAVFGISGFVVGPIIAALFLAVWQMFTDEYAAMDDPENVKEAMAEPAEDVPPALPPAETV